MFRNPRVLLFSLMLGLAPTIASAAEDDLDFDDDFFDEVSKDKRGKADRGDRELPDPDEDPMDDAGDEDPDWDAPTEPDIIDDPPEDFGDPDEFGEDPPDEPRRAAVVPTGGFDDLGEDPPDDLDRPAPPKRAAAKPPPKAAPAGPARLTLKTSGKEPLTGAYAAAVVGLDVDAVIVELPVLVASSGGSFSGGEFMVVSEFMLGDKKVGESRHLVNRATIADLGPTVLWVKQHVPVTDPSGSIEVIVSRVDAEDPPSPLFTKQVDYRL